jgi:hypothetical protein
MAPFKQLRFEAVADMNFYGAVNGTRAVPLIMRKQKSGYSSRHRQSLVAWRCPDSTPYHAAK